MRKPTPVQSQLVAHVSIVLDEVVPEVSRVVAVPLGIRLHDFHAIIQAAMGWTDTHLWLFRARGMYWGVPDPESPDDTIPASRTWLLDMIADIGTYRFKYIYDFGDHWTHTIKITKPMPAAAGVDYPLLLHAVGRCPREDCGGAEDYVALLAALRDPSDARHAEAVALLGTDVDPSKANLVRHEQEVAALARRIAPRRSRAVRAKPSARSRKTDEFF